MRHSKVLKEYDPKPGVSVATLAYEYPAGFRVPEHAHGSDQLIYAVRGMMQVFSGQRMWFIPPQLALWIPAGTQHRIYMPGAVSLRTLYFRPGLVRKLSPYCVVLHVTPLLRELILEAVRAGHLRARNHLERALRDLTIWHVKRASPVPTFVNVPTEPRARGVGERLLKNPAERETLAALCGDAGVSVRTIQRAFQKDVGMDFESWRRQVRLTKAAELLVARCSVKETAFAVGYLQCSAFVEAFRRVFGKTPRAWVSGLESGLS